MSGSKSPENAPGVEILRFLLIIVAIVLLVVGVGAAVIAVVIPTSNYAASILSGLGALLVCSVAAMWMIATAVALRMLMALTRHAQFASKSSEWLQRTITSLEEKIAAIPEPSSVPPMVVAPPTQQEQQNAAVSEQTIEMLTQVRDLLLMNEEQRAARGKQYWAARTAYLRKVIDQQIAMGDWAEAEKHVQELHTAAPDDPSVEMLARRIEEEQTKRMLAAVAAARERARHFMSITAWTQAEAVMADLKEHFPNSAEAETLAGEVRVEKEAFDRETLARLFLDLKDASEHRQWRRALGAAEELIKRYPHDKKVEKLAGDLGTIRENAEAQERREQEELFKDLLKRQRYEEALSVANSVINKYPASTSAAELNRLLPKVEELIRQATTAKQMPAV